MAIAVKWYEWGTVVRRLQLWTKALLQGRRYRVILDAEARDPVAYEDPVRRCIVVNPTAYGESDAEQWLATRGLLAHEAGHALFTDAWPEGDGTQLLKDLVNVLDDQRVEWAMCRIYPGVVPDVRFLGDLTWRAFRRKAAGKPGADSARKLLRACLAWRWACDRGGHGELVEVFDMDEAQERLWLGEVRPLVEGAWVAPTTPQVIAAARRILALLDLPEGSTFPDWLLALLRRDLPAERADEALPIPVGDGPLSLPKARCADGGPPLPGGADERPLDEDELDEADHGRAVRVPPAPYLDLEAAALPLAQALVAELQVPHPDRRPMPHQWRGRFSFRQEVRDEERPFLLAQAQAPSPEGLAMTVLVDRSGSMQDRMPDVSLAVMALHLACRDLSIPLAITVFGGGSGEGDWEHPLNVVTIQEYGEGEELPKARIAALDGHTGAEHLILALRKRGPVLAARPERLKLLVVVHDGHPVYDSYPDGHDWDLSLEWLRGAERRGITPLGVLLVDDEERDRRYVQKMKGLFEWLIVCRSQGLPAKLGNLLRCFAGQTR